MSIEEYVANPLPVNAPPESYLADVPLIRFRPPSAGSEAEFADTPKRFRRALLLRLHHRLNYRRFDFLAFKSGLKSGLRGIRPWAGASNYLSRKEAREVRSMDRSFDEVSLRKRNHRFALELVRSIAWNDLPFVLVLYKFGRDDSDQMEFTYSHGTAQAIGNALTKAGWPVLMVSNKAGSVVLDHIYHLISQVPHHEPPLAGYLELPNETWEDHVERLACLSSLVVVVLESESGGLGRELAILDRLDVRDRVIVFESPDHPADSRQRDPLGNPAAIWDREQQPEGEGFSPAIQAVLPLDITFSPCWLEELAAT